MHARAPTPCQIREPEPLDGFTQDQEKRLRSRKKKPGEELTEPEKWRAMYRILFPDMAEDDIPSPCEYDLYEVVERDIADARQTTPPTRRRRATCKATKTTSGASCRPWCGAASNRKSTASSTSSRKG